MDVGMIEDIYELSPTQQGMLFHSLYAPETGVYILLSCLTLHGALNVPAFERAWQRVLDRHSALRTSFHWEEADKPLQVVHRQVKLPLERHDWRGLAPDEQEQRLEAYLQRVRFTGFNLAEPPLMHLSIIQVAEDVYQFVWCRHHLLLDGWCLPLILKEVFALYEAFCQGRDLRLTPTPPYRAYIDWLQQQDLAQAEAFWRRMLTGFTAPTSVAVDSDPVDSAHAKSAAEQQFLLPETLTSTLQSFARRHQLTLHTLLQGAWALLLIRYSGEQDIVFGATVAGRPPELPEADSIVGLFINTLPVRVRVSPETPLLTWLRRLQAQQAELHQYEYSPLAQIQGWSEVPRGQPLFESILVFENFPAASSAQMLDASLEIRDVRSFERTSYPLTVVAAPGEKLSLRLAYDCGRFETPTIMRMGGHLQSLLESIVTDPNQRLADLPLLTETERQQVLFEWNDTGREVRSQNSEFRRSNPILDLLAPDTSGLNADPDLLTPDSWLLDSDSCCIHQLFETQVMRAPDAVAVVYADQHLTYEELNLRANRLAYHLRALGVGPDVRVGICMERSLELVVGLLGILKAGGAYVPLDPTYPAERLGFMLEDSRACVLITDSMYDLRFTIYDLEEPQTPIVNPKSKIVNMAADWPLIAQQPVTAPDSGVAPDNLAYVIYTSGSTGQPKGALLPHRGVVNRLLWMQAAYRLIGADAVLQKTPFSFDVSVWEFFWPLLAGARLVLARPGGHQDSEYLAQVIVRSQITTLHFVPSMLRIFLEEPNVATCRSLKRVLCSGEMLPFELQERFFARLSAELSNLYGPTEASIDVTFWRCQRTSDLRTVPIGRPIANTQIYLLDRSMQPVPIGVPGELYIGGVGLARGYLNRPELTAERFVPNPFTDEGRTTKDEGSDSSFVVRHSSFVRLYKTGDLARCRPDGAIEFLGRLDDQVKVRGFRVEPGEVAAALARYPAVREVVVLAREDPPGDRRLVAYVVPDREQGTGNREQEAVESGTASLSPVTCHLSPSELHQFLRERLPDYMIPGAFILLDALPLTPNGKLDRRALPAPSASRPILNAAYVAPRIPIEERLAAVWAAALGLDRVGIHDNFFELGGDSIRSIQVLAQARANGLHFSLQQLFQAQTIHRLAGVLGSGPHGSSEPDPRQPFSMISPADRARLPDDLEDAYPMTRLQVGMLFHSEYQPDSAIFHNIDSFHLRARLDLDMLETATQMILVRHPILRTSFDLAGFSEPLQLVHQTAYDPLEVEDLRHLSANQQEEALTAWLEMEQTRFFQWTRPPLLRLTVHRCTAETFQFTVTAHHAILDGWSLFSMLTELFGIYAALLETGRPPIKPPLASSFRDYVALEGEALESKEIEEYWLDKLEDSTLTRLPRWSFADCTIDTAQLPIKSLAVPLSRDVSDNLQRLAQALAVPLKSVLLAAHLRVLSLLSGQEDIVTGMVSHGRPEAADGEQVLGLFLNTLPFRLRLAGGTWADLIRATFAAEHELLPFRRYPMAEIQRKLGGQPLYETVFNFTHYHVISSLSGVRGLEHLDSSTFQKTDCIFLAGFGQDPSSSQINLTLTCHAAEWGNDNQLATIGGYYAKALAAMEREPERRYETQSLLAPEEQHQLLVLWNATDTSYLRDDCMHHMFEAQVEHTPDAIAVVYDEDYVTYAELNRQSNRIARYLHGCGVGPEVFVGICVERSAMMVAGMLGILKAGGAYVPLDPTYPTERLAFMLADVGMPVLLTQERLSRELPEAAVQIVCLDADWVVIAREDDANPASLTVPDNLAYVIYTSGSTGQPKGVAIRHQSAVSLLCWAHDRIAPEDLAVVLSATSICFDCPLFELFAPLSWGGTVILAESILHLPALPAAQGMTLLSTSPATMAELLSVHAVPPSVRRIHLAGEALQPALVQQVYQQTAVREVCNLYGPSEDTTYSTYALIQRGAEGPVTIGQPIANEQIYLLDRYLQPTPIGVPGELYIGGVGLARGYLNRPDLTAERFIPNPFARVSGIGSQVSEESTPTTQHPTPDTRLYKTGDRAYYLPDGAIQFLGRDDEQVKVRSYRVELGEIEAILAQHPLVHETVVLAREDRPGDKRLVAYVVPVETTNDVRCPEGAQTNDRAAPSSFVIRPSSFVNELRTFLKERLPAYMVPSAFVLLDALPLTRNSKVDRRALPAPDTGRPDLANAYAAPRTPTETLIATIWADVLGLDQVGIQDNFFELGGNSLQALQLASKMSIAIDMRVSIRLVFKYPSIATLADALETLSRSVEQSNQPQPKGASSMQHLSTALTIERRPLLSLFAAGKLAPVQAAAICALPRTVLDMIGLTSDEVIHGICDNLPVFSGIYETAAGRIAILTLPRFDFQLYVDKDDLLNILTEALQIAGRLGATVVSLTDLLGSATDYGRDLAAAVAEQNLPRITTGHATTASSVVLTVSGLLEQGGRDITREHVGILGLGSIGTATLRLMLRCLPHPEAITLCDVYNKHGFLEELRQEMADDLGFRGVTRILESQGSVPAGFYDATLMIGASNVPDILDITRVRPGTLIADDSGPHCFKPDLAIQRFKAQRDLLFTTAGALRAPEPVHELRYVPAALERVTNIAALERLDPRMIEGCIFSSLLSARYDDIPTTLGFVDSQTCLQHYEILDQLGFQSSQLHCTGYRLEEETIRQFRSRFGR